MVEIPKEYQAGFVYFLGQRIDLSKKPLIPRPETEYWADIAIKDIANTKNSIIECLDIFSGSGCIGISLLAKVDDIQCDLAEKEDAFLEQIRINIGVNNLTEKRFSIIKTDIFSEITKKYDYILANPPYVAENRIDEVGEDVLAHEPRVALFSGSDGMDIIRTFLVQARNHLKENGVIYLEFDQEQKEEIGDILEQNGYSDWKFFNDQFGLIRFVRINK
ncbi:MAG: peptide chain release factor N(5)-glutamine methyltransferase [Candidatus Pacebacteria bacterium]|nr:peptide chain release factor N(5)-glutamine methyltransferase [Candidatus Paceibacterota bacterium]